MSNATPLLNEVALVSYNMISRDGTKDCYLFHLNNLVSSKLFRIRGSFYGEAENYSLAYEESCTIYTCAVAKQWTNYRCIEPVVENIFSKGI